MEQLQSTTKRPIHILGIAPYDGLKILMQKIAATRDDLTLDVYVGDLKKGAEIARHLYHGNYDVIVSRGGTAEMIGQETSIPIVEISLSLFDILSSIKLAENYEHSFCLVGFSNITKDAHQLCELLQYKMDIFSIHSQAQVNDTMEVLKDKGYKMVLCDVITYNAAKNLGMNAILMTSNTASIQDAFDQAIKLCRSYTILREENNFWKDVLRDAKSETVVLAANGSVMFSSIDQIQSSEIYPLLISELPQVMKKNTKKIFRNTTEHLYSIYCSKHSFLGEPYVVFQFEAVTEPYAKSKFGIQYSNQQETEDFFFNSFFSVTSSSSNMETMIETINHSKFPVIIAGEIGTGKEQVARVIYSKSELRNNPIIIINCPLLTDKSWNFLMNHHQSPFSDNHNTFLIKDVTALSKTKRSQLLSMFIDSNFCKRNRVILSCNCPTGKTLPETALEFVNALSCVTIHLSSLRECTSKLPTLSSLYLSMLNAETGKQIIGFEPEAMALLKEFDWPYNYAQFKRLLNELVLTTTTPYIKTEYVAKLLTKEMKISHTDDNRSINAQEKTPAFMSEETLQIDAHRPLDAMIQQIIMQIMQETGGNQSAAAKRLGISRTTLWRYLKER